MTRIRPGAGVLLVALITVAAAAPPTNDQADAIGTAAGAVAD